MQGKPDVDKKCVTINVQGCKSLRTDYGDSSKLAPFFYYQFYKFPERMSQTSSGSNPKFKDVQTYEVTYDRGAQKFFQEEKLEIMFVDDNAPLTGLERGGQSRMVAAEDDNSDMIGQCSIPLKELESGNLIHGDFTIVGQRGEDRGRVTV